MKKYVSTILLLLGVTFVSAQEIDSLPNVDGKVWTLEECLAYAVDNSITVKDAEYTEETAEVTYQQSKDNRLPNLTGSASQSLTNGQSIDPITSDYVNQQINSTSLGLSSSVALFQGNQLRNQIKQNKILVDQNSLYVQEAKNNIILSVTEAYLQALYAKEGIAVAEKNLEATSSQAEQAKARYEAGSIAMQDYSDAISQAATNKYNLIDAKNSYAQQIIVLKQLLELSPMVEFDVATPDTDAYESPILPNKYEIYESALGMLPEYKAAELGVEVSEKDLDISKGDYLPTLSLSGSLGSGYTSTQDLGFYDQLDVNFNQRLSLSLSIPIFNRNQTKAAVQKAKIAIDQSKIQQQTVQKEIYQKIETAYQNVLSAQEQLSAAEAASNAAEESYKLAQKKYDLGALSTTDLVVSQNTFTVAQQNYLQAKYLNILYTQLLQFYQGKDIKI
ncbi:outer membrane protein [Pustulibacterium marinum]|uniref:Outer membrane protein n=1 Tax=Pustulibacterium marinum TaxID=1224947 RepID=A0A1I7FRV4_9FLAO|nr:TolC family protein [Pustulibacterium marinum]SFU38871.1 outer membrane protein [Pustulibacterium marinum]